jgi:hypothetical protein
MERHKTVGLIGFSLSLIALALPWLEIRGALGLGGTIYGFTTDGVVSFILLVICLGLLFTRTRIWKTVIIALLSLIALGVTVSAINRVMDILNREKTALVITSWGPGIGLMILATLVVFAAGLMMSRTPRSSPPPQEPKVT